jgi:Bacterial Ig-like domain (group 3)/IPT/TIG domain
MLGFIRWAYLAAQTTWTLNPSRGRLSCPTSQRTTFKLETLEDRVVPTLLGQQLFPSDYPWNQDISAAPVVANSAAIIAHIGASIHLHPDWGADDPANGSDPLYGIPINIVHGNSTATVNVIIDNYSDESDIVPVPIPANAVLEGDFQNGPNPNGGGYNANQRGDSHLIVWDEDTDTAYELFGVTRPSDPTLFPNTSDMELPHTDGLWHAAQETVWNMNADNFRTLGATSADAAGLSILAGLARPDEGLTIAQGGQGVINHALRMTLPAGDINPQYIYPASHMVTVSQGSDHLPLGSRLRLANTTAVNNLINDMPPESQIVAHAMQQYGLIVADIGSAMYVTGASASVDANNNIDHTWDLDDIFASNGLKALTAGDFQVVNLTPVVTGLSTNSGAAGSAITITGQNFSGAAGHISVFFGATPAGSVNVVSDTQITAVVPTGSGMVDVTVQSGVNETDDISSNPNANVNAPIFGYGTSTTSSGDLFTYLSDTTTALADNGPNPSTFGQSVSFTATVSGGSPINGQTVFIEDATDSFIVVASPTLVNSTVNFTISDLPVGSHHLIAVYNGDTTHASSNDSGSLTPVIQVVNAAPAPQFVSIETNGGTVQYHDAFGNGSAEPIADQNSVVEQILVTFNEPVTLAPGAFSVVPYSINNGIDPLVSGEVLVNSGLNPNQIAPLLNDPIQVGDGHQWIITFGNNGGTTPNGAGFYVLKDGVYSLNIDHTKVSANSQIMAADVGGPGAASFWALYGDTTFHDISGVDHPGYIGDTYSDASVGNADFQAFKACSDSDSTNYYAPPNYNVKFDANLDGSVANSDFVQFKTNYNTDWQF